MKFEKHQATPGKTGYVAHRYERDTPAERAAYVELYQSDPTITPPPVPAWRPLNDYTAAGAIYKERFGKMGSLSTGLPSVDQLCLGFDPGEYAVLGAGTNQGKTQLAIYMALAQTVPTLYISRELPQDEINGRFQFIAGATNLPDNLYIQEDHQLTPDSLLALITGFTAKHGAGFIVIDHIHAFIRGEGLTAGLGMLSAALRDQAITTKTTILALSQLNRKDYKPETGPENWHLKESGYLEDDAYTIMMAWREQANLHLKLTKSRRRDISEPGELKATLHARAGKLTDPLFNTQETIF